MVELNLQRNILFHGYTRSGRIFELVEFSHGSLDVAKELVGHITAESILTYYTHHHYILDIGRHRIGRNHPSLLSQLILKIEQGPACSLLMFRSHVPAEQRIDNFIGIVGKLRHAADLAMQIFRYGHSVELYFLIALESKAYKLIVLTQDLSGRTREVTTYLLNLSTELVDTERHFARQILLVTPYYPTEARINKAVLMT